MHMLLALWAHFSEQDSHTTIYEHFLEVAHWNETVERAPPLIGWEAGRADLCGWTDSWQSWASLDGGGGGGGGIADGGRRNEWNLRRERESKSSCLSQANSFSPQVEEVLPDLCPAPCHYLCCWHSVPSWQQIKNTYFKPVVIQLYFCPSCISEYWICGKEINTKVSEKLSFVLLSQILVDNFGTDICKK